VSALKILLILEDALQEIFIRALVERAFRDGISLDIDPFIARGGRGGVISFLKSLASAEGPIEYDLVVAAVDRNKEFDEEGQFKDALDKIKCPHKCAATCDRNVEEWLLCLDPDAWMKVEGVNRVFRCDRNNPKESLNSQIMETGSILGAEGYAKALAQIIGTYKAGQNCGYFKHFWDCLTSTKKMASKSSR
jgi:hypothetical protein